jgi:hypothetical protein
VLQRVKEERNILEIIIRRNADWIGHILRRNFLLKHVIEGKIEGRIEGTGRRGRRLGSYCMALMKSKKEAIDRTLWRTRFGRCVGPVVRETAE